MRAAVCGAGASAAPMDTDEQPPKNGADKPEAERAAAEKAKEEPSSYELENPTRIVPAQEKFVSFPASSRWQPLRTTHAVTGILVLKDTRPGQAPLGQA